MKTRFLPEYEGLQYYLTLKRNSGEMEQKKYFCVNYANNIKLIYTHDPTLLLICTLHPSLATSLSPPLRKPPCLKSP